MRSFYEETKNIKTCSKLRKLEVIRNKIIEPKCTNIPFYPNTFSLNKECTQR